MTDRKSTERLIDTATSRIGRQVDRLIVPDFRPLGKTLRDLSAATQQERRDALRQMDRTRAKAMAAATRLMLLRDADWQKPKPSYFTRVKQLEQEAS